jgi:GNAT superfamily N-acetyltransferase
MEIRILSDRGEELRQVATWIYNEWGYVSPENSVDKFCGLLSSRCNSRAIPITLVAVDSGSEIVGTVSLVENEFKSKPELTPFLGSLFVPLEHRQKGIGKVLCQKVLEEAKRLGYSKCYLVTDKKKAFYSGRGWKTILEYVYRNAPAYLMEITL